MEKKIFGVIAASMCLTACGAQEMESQEVTAYYVETHSYYATAMSQFQNKHDEIELEMVGFGSDEELVTQLATEMAAGKGPDVVLLSGDTTFDLYKAAKSGQLLELNTYLEKDITYKPENYMESVMDAGKMIEEQQLVMPFSYSIDVMYMEESTYQEWGVSETDLENFQTMAEMVLRCTNDVDEEKISHMIPNTLFSNQFNEERYLLSAGVVEAGEYDFTLDEQGLVNVQKYVLALKSEHEKKQKIGERLINNPFEVTKSFTLNGNYINGYATYNGMTEFFTGEKCVTIPWRNMEGKIQPFVCDFGFVTAQSDSKQAAYDLLRYMMDYEIMTSSNRPMSVSKAQMEKNLKILNLKKQKLAKEPYSSMKLTEADMTKLRNELQDMATAKWMCCGYWDILIEYIYANDEVDMEKFKNVLWRYIDE